ncbi:MAG: sigma-70 family RNA polymerase sigma factor [Oscillospiraceae bacterium]|nr:sigma-70 family RNA polymerase sigma factor [Oscillospiraceae bacterium]
MDEAALLELLRSDPQQGMTALIDAYGGLIHAVVRGKLRGFGQSDVEACVADAFSEFYCDLDRYDPAQGSIRSWLCVIARHNALDLLRRHYREGQTVSLDDESAPPIADDFSMEGDPEDRVFRAELAEAVKALGRPDSEIILRKYWLGQSSKEIARALRMTVSNVDTRTHRAIGRLRERFGGE